MNERLRILLCANAFALLAAVPARATELCVKCTGPNASYACVVGDTSNPTLDSVSKFYCITSLAKAGSHASCAIDRNLNPPCPGERRELPIPAFLNEPGDDAAVPKDASSAALHQKDPQVQGAIESSPSLSPEKASAPAQAPETQPAEQQPPKTVEEIMQNSAKSAGDSFSQTQKTAGEAAKSASTALEKAGSAVGGAAKSSWKCLSSFFSNC